MHLTTLSVQQHQQEKRCGSAARLSAKQLLLFGAYLFFFALLGGAVNLQAQTSVGDVTTPGEDSCDSQSTADLHQPRYLALWRESTGTNDWLIVESWAAFLLVHQQHNSSLVDIDTFVEDGTRFYAGLWRSEAGTGGEELTNDLGLLAFFATRAAMESEGYGLVDFEALEDVDSTRFLAVWKMGEMPTEYILFNSASIFETEATSKMGTHKMVEFETWIDDASRRYLGFFRPRLRNDAGQQISVSQLWCGFHNDFHDLEPTHRLDDLEFYLDSLGNRRYASVWTETSGGDHLWIGFTAAGFDGAEKKVRQETPELRLHDFEIIDDPEAMAALGLESANRVEGDAVANLALGFGATTIHSGGLTTEEDGTIIGAPPLHDTGSSGPD